MIPARHVPHEDADLTGVDLAAVATPWPFHPDRMRAPLGETAGIKSDDAIGFPQPRDHLADQHLDQWPVIPGRGTDEVLQDLSLDLDQGGNLLGILPGQVGEQTLEVAVHLTLVGRGLQGVLIGHHELAQTVHHLMEDVGRHETIAQYFLSPLGPRRCHLCASSPWPVDT
jgi:hypothetical protein